MFTTGIAVMFLMAGCSMAKDGAYEVGSYAPGGDGSQYGEKYEEYGENPFFDVADAPVSTFSVDCDGASYSNMRRWINLGQNPPKASIRVEEFINYFSFDYPEPTDGHNVSVDTETVPCPWNGEHELLRIGLKGKDIPLSQLPATNYVFLIDVSGSMASPDKLGILKTGFLALTDVLNETDRVAIVTYSGNVRVALPSTHGDERNKIREAIQSLSASGSTAGGAAIKMAYDIAVENFIPGGNNRIILGTDGDFNVGISSDDDLVELIQDNRDKGVYITVLGVGGGNLNDSMMEKVANNGNGTYEYIDNADQIEKVFVNERSKFYAVAKDCKIQVTFNPERVGKYRLIGYENRVMSNEDFEDDTKDAGDIGVGQTVTALYEIIPVDETVSAPFASLEVRYKRPGEDESVVLEKTTSVAVTTSASSETRFAAHVHGAPEIFHKFLYFLFSQLPHESRRVEIKSARRAYGRTAASVPMRHVSAMPQLYACLGAFSMYAVCQSF